MKRAVFVFGVFLISRMFVPSPAQAGPSMALVGTLAPWDAGQYSNVAADASRHVAYLGSFDDQGVAVIDTRDPANPVMTDHLSTHIVNDVLISDSADLDVVGGRLAVSHQRLVRGPAFEGISVYDISSDPYHPVLLRRIPIPGGVHTVQIDPEVDSGRPYAYANSEGSWYMWIVNLETGAILSQYASSEGIGCIPSFNFCLGFNFAHEGFIQRHPRSGRVLDYVSFWDSGLRIVDVTDPAHPVEVGAFDYNRLTNGLTSAHYAAATPSANWVYLEDEIGYLETGGVHVLDTSACDGTSYCTPTLTGEWHIQGHPVQSGGLNGLIHGNAFQGPIDAANKRSFTYDAHNLDVRGEDELLVANYAMGIRLIDTSDKKAPVLSSFFMPNSNQAEACKMDCGFNSRLTWGSYFGSDGRIYASDLSRGFFIVEPRATGSRAAATATATGAIRASTAPRESATHGPATPLLTLRAAGASVQFAFETREEGPVRLNVYDVQGRLRGSVRSERMSSGYHTIAWNGVATMARGVYFARLETSEGVSTAKFVALGGR